MHLIEEILGPRGVRLLAVVVECSVIAFFVYLLPNALHLSLSQIDMLSRGLGIPRIWVTLPVPLAAGLTLLVCLSNLAHQVADLLRPAAEAAPTPD
jgi:TRAP-type C4-dicarboxylate transport system permease small subunit